MLPSLYDQNLDEQAYLKSYVSVYLKEELIQEGIIRNIQSFSRFLEAASYSQASILNVSQVARDVDKDPKVISDYFEILEDLLIAYRLPVFDRRGKRKTIKRRKFYFFDTGVYKAIRPSGPLDNPKELQGHSFETLILQELIALNEYRNWNYKISFWHTVTGLEVDFILYGKRGFHAIECQLSTTISSQNLKSLKAFQDEFRPAQLKLIYSGQAEMIIDGIQIIPAEKFLLNMERYLI